MPSQKSSRVSRKNLADIRRMAVKAVWNGLSPEDAAVAFGAGRSTVFGWLKIAADGGLEALGVKQPPGAEPKLTEQQLNQVRRWVVGKDPRQLAFDFALWTRDMVRELIEREFGVTYTPQGVGNLLRRMGLSPQKPLVRAYEQDPERVKRWKEVEYPAIRARAKEEDASIFFLDEASVRTDCHRGTTWGEIGRTPVVKGTGARLSVNMISAVSPRGKLHFSFLPGNGNSVNFIDYLGKLMHDIPGKLFLIVDGHSSHTSGETRNFFRKHSDRLEVFFLPPYSPELNPDEWVWKNIKHDKAGRLAARTREELQSGIAKAVARLQETSEIVFGFFRDPDLAYIGS